MINKRIKRFLSMLMCMVVIVTSPCTSVFAYTDYESDELKEVYEEDIEEEIVCQEPIDETDEDLFMGYMLQEAGALVNDTDENASINEDSGNVYVERGSLLAGNEKWCYDFLKEQFVNIAAGKRADTVIYIPFPENIRQEYTAEMLGIESIYDNGIISAEAEAAMASKIRIDRRYIVRCLLMDMPYELYWYDKVKGFTYPKNEYYKLRAENKNGVDTIWFEASQYDEPAWRFSFFVAKAYSQTNELKTTKFNTDLAVKAYEAAAKAAEDVVSIAESVSSDYAKLKKYKDIIRAYSSYNHEAIASNYTGGYGDPWQMIYVFDNDPATKVVCEGFSKAFKFLCDLSSFAGDIDCSLVSGFMGQLPYDPDSTPGPHMWNNVRMADGNVYLVDVTNASGDNPSNFLGGAVYQSDMSYSKTSGADAPYITYAYSCGSHLYYYDKFTMSLYDDSELVYSTERYNPQNLNYTCNITLSMNYANGGKQLISVYKDEDSKDKIISIIPKRDGYSFSGWYTAGEGGEAIADKTKLVVSDNKTVLYAHWNALTRYTVTAHSGRGIFSDETKSMTAEMYDGKNYYDTFEVPVSNDHYEFTNWYEDESCSENSIIKEKDVFNASRSREIYAGWKLKKYKLTIYANGGEFYDGVTSGKILTYNALSVLSNPAKYTPVRTGYEFVGWFTQADGGEEYDISQPIERSLSVYAHWKKLEVIPVPEPGPNDTEDVSENKPITPSENKPRPKDDDSVSVNGFYATFADQSMYKDGKGIWHAVYSGEKLTPEVRVYDNRVQLTEGVDYSLKYVNNLKAYEVSGSTAYAEIKGKGNMKGSYKLNFVIDRLSLQSVSVCNLCVKEGSESKADPALVYNGRTLKKNKDYSYEIRNNTVQIKGIGSCSGNFAAALTVQSAAEYKKNAIKVKLNAPPFIYDGSEKVLKAGSELIVSDKSGADASYMVSYSANVNAGTVRVTVCGTGNNHGVVKKSFRIKPCKVKGTDAFEIKHDKSAIYKKGGAKAKVMSIVCKATGEKLKEGRDYSLVYGNSKKSGTAKIKLKFMKNYKGSSYPVLKYEILKQSLADAAIYAGDMAFSVPKKYSPKVAVICNGSLVDPKEYSVGYTENRKLYEPKDDIPVSVVSKEKNYTGYAEAVSVNVTTEGIDVNNAKIVYIGGSNKQCYEGRGEAVSLVPGKDFKIKISKDLVIDNAAEIEQNFTMIYADNTSKGNATMILLPTTGKYTGIIKTTFKIRAAEIKTLVE